MKAISLFLLSITMINAHAQQEVTLFSPDEKIEIFIRFGDKLMWSVRHDQTLVIDFSEIAMELGTGQILGNNMHNVSLEKSTVDENFKTPFYKKATIRDHYEQLILINDSGYRVIFRAYNDGVAYRFETSLKETVRIKSEISDFNFGGDLESFIPYVRDLRSEEMWMQSFEATYDESKLSEMREETIAFLPIMIALEDGKKAVITEADLQDYPGMYVQKSKDRKNSISSIFPPVIVESYNGGIGNMNVLARKRGDYIAEVKGTRKFPWRSIIISEEDKELLNNDMVQKLAEPSRIADESWIKPGKIAWDWWNDWQLAGVDFEAGINTITYKYYIDFAAANGLEYIIIDDGWSDRLDLFSQNPDIDLNEVMAYSKAKNVGVILWSSWFAFTRDMEAICKKFSQMGVAGFKVDFFDRDDQEVLASVYEMSAMAAKYQLMMDYHGIFKPQGLQRTYPNVLNFEGVKGLENTKWVPNDDIPRYDTSIPFIRQVAGPMDYTPGAMRNRNRANFRTSYSMPMSQGTRAHQVAMYVIFEAPLQMLADSPTAYMKEQETTDFIAQIPTVFDQTVPLVGKVGEEVVLAREKEGIWYLGGLGNWSERDIEIDLSFLGPGTFSMEEFKDGLNANRNAEDYSRSFMDVDASSKLKLHLASGGGWAAIIKRK